MMRESVHTVTLRFAQNQVGQVAPVPSLYFFSEIEKETLRSLGSRSHVSSFMEGVSHAVALD